MINNPRNCPRSLTQPNLKLLSLKTVLRWAIAPSGFVLQDVLAAGDAVGVKQLRPGEVGGPYLG
jgi:hypothetical protein